jgi:hypothetical protein
MFIFADFNSLKNEVCDDLFGQCKDLREDFYKANKEALKTGKLNLEIIRRVLERYGFEGISIGDEQHDCSYRDDLTDAFSHFKNKYMNVRFREF